MKRIAIILSFIALCLPTRAGIHTYADQSVLANGSWVKIRVSESGVCRMSFDELRQAGIDPSQVRVYGYGGAQKEQDFSIRNIDDLPAVPIYKGTDYILFWAQGPISWKYDKGTSRFVHTRNTYSNYGYYFLTTGASFTPDTIAISETGTAVTTYPYYQVRDNDYINLIDREGVSGGGRTFYGEQFAAGEQKSFSFSTPNAITGENSTVYIDLAGYCSSTSSFSASINSGTSKSVTIAAPEDHYTFGVVGTIQLSGATEASKQDILIRYNSGNSSGLGWLNYIEITTPSAMTMTGDYMPIRSTVNYCSSTPVTYHLSGVTNNSMMVWDVTEKDSIRPVEVTIANGEATWTGYQTNKIHEYVAFYPAGTNFISAQVVGTVQPQDLHALSDIDYVIICPEGYEAQATRLAQAHEQKQSITWAVVTDQQVYNEFSSGTPDATAYRWLMKMLYDRANNGIGQKPRWLLLMGHGTFDNRKILDNSGANLLLTYQSYNSVNEVKAYATDDYFGFLDDSEGVTDRNGIMDIGVGRLPVVSVSEATTTVDKLITYIQNQQLGKWKNQLVYLADDGENGMHTRTAEQSAELVRVKNPDFVVHKIFLDAYPQEINASGESYPLAKNKVLNLLKSGALFFDYSGHGGYNAITNESILNQKDIESMTNANQAFWFFATCNFAQFDGSRRCAAESAVLNPNGGAIGILAATRTVYATQNTNLNRAVCDTLFGHANVFHYEMSLGEAIAIGKNKLKNDENKLAYVLLGDPAIRLNYPTDYQVHTTTAIDTLNALSVQYVEGQIIDEDSMVVSDFNGKVDITIYDKLQEIPTRDNDNVGGEPEVVSYLDYPSKLFSGSTTVTEGLFHYTFMVPKDIRYNMGNGRIVYYAYSTDSIDQNYEAVGHFHDFIIGGSSAIVTIDTVGPEMVVYLNSPAFPDGGKSYPTPRFFAELEDVHGINTAGAGIGHDLMLTVDNDPKQTYVLNDYFTAESNSFTKGQVSYLMDKMTDGPHSLTFRAWDLLNNSTTKSLNFVIETGLDPSIYSVTTYPNPVQAEGIVNLIVNYDQPDELLQTDVALYAINGQIVYSHTQKNPDAVSINIAQLGLQPGIYVYTVKIKSASSGYNATSGKIIVTK